MFEQRACVATERATPGATPSWARPRSCVLLAHAHHSEHEDVTGVVLTMAPDTAPECPARSSEVAERAPGSTRGQRYVTAGTVSDPVACSPEIEDVPADALGLQVRWDVREDSDSEELRTPSPIERTASEAFGLLNRSRRAAIPCACVKGCTCKRV